MTDGTESTESTNPSSSFVSKTPQDLFPGFREDGRPKFDDFWVKGTEWGTKLYQEQQDAWHREMDRWQLAMNYVSAHRRNDIPEEFSEAYAMHPKVYAWAQDLIDGATPNILIIIGGVGTGKTHSAVTAACWLATVWRQTSFPPGPGAQFYTASRWLRAMKNFHRPDEIEEAEFRAEKSKVLILDDLTRPTMTDFDHEVLTSLFDKRRKNWPTIITSNVDRRVELEDAFNSHLSSRLLGGATIVRIAGEDRRRA